MTSEQPRRGANENTCGFEVTAETTATMTLAGLFELAGKVAQAERRRDFQQKKVREVSEEIEKLEAELRTRRASLELRKTEVEALSLELDAHNGAVDWAGGLPDALWEKIAGLLDEEDAVFPFALTCRRFREMQKRVSSARGKTGLRSKLEVVSPRGYPP